MPRITTAEKAKSDIELALSIFGIEFEKEYKFHPRRKWRFDFAIPDKRIAIEFEGGTFSFGGHTRGAGFRKDCDKYNMAGLMGWTVFRVESRHLALRGAYGGYFACLIQSIKSGEIDRRMELFGYRSKNPSL